MSFLPLMALPGGMRTAGSNIMPEDLFVRPDPDDASGAIKIKNVRVRIFDLSNKDEREEYEKLWAELLVKTSLGLVTVESSKDLVRRADGTSYWLKYVEYVEFDDGKHKSIKKPAKHKKGDSNE